MVCHLQPKGESITDMASAPWTATRARNQNLAKRSQSHAFPSDQWSTDFMTPLQQASRFSPYRTHPLPVALVLSQFILLDCQLHLNSKKNLDLKSLVSWDLSKWTNTSQSCSTSAGVKTKTLPSYSLTLALIHCIQHCIFSVSGRSSDTLKSSAVIPK